MYHYTEDKDFFDLKRFPAVMELNSETDAYSLPINIPGGLIFGHEIVNTAFVSVMDAPPTMS